MAYQINKTDGTIIATVADGQVDKLSTDITLIGKNYAGYGDDLNENFIKILENFADTKRPSNPITGQLWFDTTETTLKIYSGKEFVPVSSTAISDRQPASLRVGDLWFDNINKQLNFYDGENLVLVSPDYTVGQGKSGFIVESILDTLGQTRVITKLYTGGVLLGIFAKDSFAPKIAITGFTGGIEPGFNVADVAGIKFDVTCTNADNLGGHPHTDFLKTNGENVIQGQLSINSDAGLMIGRDPNNATFLFSDSNVVLSNHVQGGNLLITTRKSFDQDPAIHIYASERKVALYEGFSTSEVEVGGSLTVDGDLVVKGTTTTLSTSELVIADKNITLAKQDGMTSTDINANGGGITVEGDTNHSLTWTLPGVWTSSEHFNLTAGNHYSISDYPLIQQIDPNDPTQGFKLTDHIKEIDGISIFGKREQILVGPYPVDNPPLLIIENSTITTYDSNDLVLAPDGDVVLTTSPAIKGLADPTDDQDATTKSYVDEANKLQTIFLSTALSDPNELIDADYYDLLNTMIPSGSVINGTLVKLLCTVVSNVGASVSPTVNTSSESFCVSDGLGQPSGSDAPAITAVGVNEVDIPAQDVTVSRIIKTFRYQGSGWTLISDESWSPS